MVRNFLSDKTKRTTIPSGSVIWNRYQLFIAELPALAEEMKWDCDELTFVENVMLITTWLEKTNSKNT